MQKILIISLKTISSQSFEEAGGRIFDIAKFLSKKIIVKLGYSLTRQKIYLLKLRIKSFFKNFM